jgi:hypothetical protein
MEFTPDAVDIFTNEFTSTMKYRICVGYEIGERLYYMHKFGVLYPTVEGEALPTERIIESARRTYDAIEAPGEITIPVFAYHFGVPCEFDEDGEPIGDWPQIGRLVLQYNGKFLMPSAKLPQGYRHLSPFRLPIG